AAAPPAAPPPAAPPPAGEPLMPPPAAAAPDPDRDAKALARQAGERPSLTAVGAASTAPLPPPPPVAPAKTPPAAPNGDIAARPSDVFAEDWWSGARPVFEIHGYFRVRAELFHNFALGRSDATGIGGTGLWPQPIDNTYPQISPGGQYLTTHNVY